MTQAALTCKTIFQVQSHNYYIHDVFKDGTNIKH